MPWGDCTGPWWLGSRGNRASGNYNPWCRRAAGNSRGFGRGFALYPNEHLRQPTPDEEKSYLEAVARDLEKELKSVRAQIDKLQSRP